MRGKPGYIWPSEDDNSLQAPAGFSLSGSQWSLVGPDEKIENVRRRTSSSLPVVPGNNLQHLLTQLEAELVQDAESLLRLLPAVEDGGAAGYEVQGVPDDVGEDEAHSAGGADQSRQLAALHSRQGLSAMTGWTDGK